MVDFKIGYGFQYVSKAFRVYKAYSKPSKFQRSIPLTPDQKEEVTLLLVCNSKSFIGTNPYYASKKFRPPVDLYLISEKSIWKNQV